MDREVWGSTLIVLPFSLWCPLGYSRGLTLLADYRQVVGSTLDTVETLPTGDSTSVALFQSTVPVEEANPASFALAMYHLSPCHFAPPLYLLVELYRMGLTFTSPKRHFSRLFYNNMVTEVTGALNVRFVFFQFVYHPK